MRSSELNPVMLPVWSTRACRMRERGAAHAQQQAADGFAPGGSKTISRSGCDGGLTVTHRIPSSR
jgi:hypothetical protein